MVCFVFVLTDFEWVRWFIWTAPNILLVNLPGLVECQCPWTLPRIYFLSVQCELIHISHSDPVYTGNRWAHFSVIMVANATFLLFLRLCVFSFCFPNHGLHKLEFNLSHRWSSLFLFTLSSLDSETNEWNFLLLLIVNITVEFLASCSADWSADFLSAWYCKLWTQFKCWHHYSMFSFMSPING